MTDDKPQQNPTSEASTLGDAVNKARASWKEKHKDCPHPKDARLIDEQKRYLYDICGVCGAKVESEASTPGNPQTPKKDRRRNDSPVNLDTGREIPSEATIPGAEPLRCEDCEHLSASHSVLHGGCTVETERGTCACRNQPAAPAVKAPCDHMLDNDDQFRGWCGNAKTCSAPAPAVGAAAGEKSGFRSWWWREASNNVGLSERAIAERAWNAALGQGGGKLMPCSECESLRSALASVHHALGESEYSDDASLGETVAAFLSEHRAALADFRSECREMHGPDIRERAVKAEAMYATVGDWNKLALELAGWKIRAEKAEAALAEIVSLLQRKLQPGGSPPPFGPVDLAAWIIDAAREELKRLRVVVEAAKDYRQATRNYLVCDDGEIECYEAMEESGKDLDKALAALEKK